MVGSRGRQRPVLHVGCQKVVDAEGTALTLGDSNCASKILGAEGRDSHEPSGGQDAGARASGSSASPRLARLEEEAAREGWGFRKSEALPLSPPPAEGPTQGGNWDG